MEAHSAAVPRRVEALVDTLRKYVRQLEELGLDDAQREAILVSNPRRLLAA